MTLKKDNYKRKQLFFGNLFFVRSPFKSKHYKSMFQDSKSLDIKYILSELYANKKMFITISVTEISSFIYFYLGNFQMQNET